LRGGKPIDQPKAGDNILPGSPTESLPGTELIFNEAEDGTTKPLGLGTTGRSEPANLKEKYAIEQAISNPAVGR